ncbi:AraC family transcriptional regulator [Paenibacillus sp. M1]|uniref:AraC family transcriptional regulator n=1 Tax=Paenibacillus haidiansis TaxID=1574488 RepID=A0ABU7VL80_9BACL
MEYQNLQILTAGYSLHSKPFHIFQPEGLENYLIRLQTVGRCRTRLSGRLELLEPGDLLLVSPEDPYELRIEPETTKAGEPVVNSGDYHIFLAGPWVKEWWAKHDRPRKLKVPLSEGIVGTFRQIMLEQRRISNPSPEIAEYYLKILCMEIDRNLLQQPLPAYPNYLAHRIKNFIEENASNQFKLEDAAAHVGVSVSRAVHLFKEAFDTSIIQYTLEVRLSMARERIIFSPLTLEHVAESSGFPSYNYFHKMFRKRYGMSPKQFRQSARNPENS